MSSPEPFRVRMAVRVYKLDPQRHLAGPAHLQYADQSRFACMEAAGISVNDLLADGSVPSTSRPRFATDESSER
jgi:acyl-CoA thioester hydrolase